MSKDGKNVNKLIKIMYFDEDAAMDYVTIKNDGNITTEEIKKVIEGNTAEVQVGADAGIKASLLKMIGLSLNVKSDIEGKSNREKIINSTITTNIMTEFIKIADKDKKISKLYGYKLEIDKDTLTYIKSVFPYISLLKDPERFDELKEINLSKVDEVILSTKGYFEFLAIKDDKYNAILRFNINCLRNNYKFNDLSKMDLCYYGIKVGQSSLDSLKIENEINQDNMAYTEDDLKTTNVSKEVLPIYDIIIAGVKNA